MAAEGLDPVPAPGGGQQQATAAPSNAVLAAATRVKGAATALLAQAKPWSELADRSAFSKPGDLAEVGGDWGSLQRQENAKMRHRFFFLQGERRRFFLSLFFSKKRKRAASLFARPRPLAPPKWHQPRCGKRVREVPLPPRAQTCSNRSIGGGARGDIFGWQRERETLARLLDGRRSKEPGGEKNQRGAEPGLFSLSLSLSLSLSFHSFFWLRKLFSLRGNANMEKLSPLSF